MPKIARVSFVALLLVACSREERPHVDRADCERVCTLAQCGEVTLSEDCAAILQSTQDDMTEVSLACGWGYEELITCLADLECASFDEGNNPCEEELDMFTDKCPIDTFFDFLY